MTEAVYEMFWDCRYCGQKKLLGLTHRFCAGCGGPQDPAARYFPPDSEKVAVHQHVFVGADVHCPACRQPMSRAAKCCTNCGSPIDRGAEVALRPPPGTAPVGGAWAGGAPAMGAFSAPRAPTKSKTGLVIAIIAACFGALLLLVFALVLVAAFWTRDGTFEVAGHEWERSIVVERYDSVRKTAWCDDMPSGAREVSRRREKRSTKKIADGQTCTTRKKDNGDGTFREVKDCTTKYRDESVMDDKCSFDVMEWRTARTLVEKGASPTDPPRWPAVEQLRGGTCLGCERPTTRKESYKVLFKGTKPGEEGSCSLPEAKWKTFERGSRWKGKVGVLTDAVECDELTRQ